MRWRRLLPGPVRRYARDRLYGFQARDDPFRIGLELFSPHLPAAPVIVEAGAHVGSDTRAMARRWRSAKVHAFEPVPELFELLEQNVGSLAGVQCYPLALGAVTGEVPMWLSSGASDGSSSLRAPKTHLTSHPDVLFEAVATVRSVTLDDWSNEHGILPDLLWLDLQGAELDALRGGESVLEHVRLIHTEVSVIEEYEGGALYSELRSWLGQRGFEVLVEAVPADAPQGNVLFGRCG
jgi:2-O-methyltransferase